MPRSTVLCARASARERVEHDDDVLAVLHETARVLQHHLRDVDVALGGLVEARRDDLAAPHVIISLTSSGRSSTSSTSSVAVADD